MVSWFSGVASQQQRKQYKLPKPLASMSFCEVVVRAVSIHSIACDPVPSVQVFESAANHTEYNYIQNTIF